MNCTTCRYELSQCLDGRLPSGRRTEVMNHAESCATCGSFWLELQAAQELSLSLQQAEISPNFRKGLWDRINAGEGTPSAVFQEQVPLWSKVRYTLSGAAAAAALLIGVTLLMKDEAVTPTTTDLAANNNGDYSNGDSSNGWAPNEPLTTEPMTADLASTGGFGSFEPRRQLRLPPEMEVARRLSTEVLAVETAHQLEERLASAALGMRMMNNPASNRASAIALVINSAHEMRDFIEVLIDLRDRQGLTFTDAGIDADLQFAVTMLENVGAMEAPRELTVEKFIEPVLTRSGRLANVSRSIRTKPTTNIHIERSYLLRINTMRPEVFRKLFRVVEMPNQMRQGTVFLLQDDCGMGWVAPMSEIKRLNIK